MMDEDELYLPLRQLWHALLCRREVPLHWAVEHAPDGDLVAAISRLWHEEQDAALKRELLGAVDDRPVILQFAGPWVRRFVDELLEPTEGQRILLACIDRLERGEAMPDLRRTDLRTWYEHPPEAISGVLHAVTALGALVRGDRCSPVSVGSELLGVLHRLALGGRASSCAMWEIGCANLPFPDPALLRAWLVQRIEPSAKAAAS